MAFDIMNVTLAIVVGTLAAIVYSLRVLVLMERRISRIEGHVESISAKILKEELAAHNIGDKSVAVAKQAIIPLRFVLFKITLCPSTK